MITTKPKQALIITPVTLKINFVLKKLLEIRLVFLFSKKNKENS